MMGMEQSHCDDITNFQGVAEINTFVLNSTVPILIVLCGPTATGKSGLAIKLAEQLNGVILSADSRQVYRKFDIGTAKPPIADQRAVPHYLIDICDPQDTLTLAEYQQQAQTLIAQFHQPLYEPLKQDELPEGFTDRRSTPIPFLVGGTGLYIRSVIRGLRIPRVAPQPDLRSQLTALGQSQCYAFLKQVDPQSAAKIHPHDQVRTLRALEVFYVSGQPISEQQGEAPPDYPILQIGLDCMSPAAADQPDLLTQRIQQRTDQMFAEGFVAEVDELCRTYGADSPLLNTLGYQEVKQYLAGKCSLQDARDLTILHTRQFAKRQRTWFRADPDINWFDANSPDLLTQVSDRIQQFIVRQNELAMPKE